MNPDVIQFQCSACQHVLTVPSHLAGVSGPCPMCGTVVTSPVAAPVSFSPQGFGAPQTQAAPVLPTSAGIPPMMAPGPVMPMPNKISQHVSPLGGGTASGAFPAQQPAAHAWQPPGLGQTILESTPQMAAPMSSPGMPGGFLPPSRPAGQMPMTGSLTGAAPAPVQAAWGNGLQQPVSEPMQLPARGGSMHGHSALIPGAPTLPTMGGSGLDGTGSGSLMGRGMPSAPLASPIQYLDTSNGMSGVRASPSAPPAMRSRPLKKPKRASNVFMVGLALLFLAGSIAAGGWLFREPIMELVERFKPALQSPVEAVKTPLPVPATSEVVKSDEPSKPAAPVEEAPKPPQMAESPTPQSTPSFDPTEPASATIPLVVPPKAQPATASEIAEAMKKPDLTSKTPQPETPPTSNPNTALVEVPSKSPTSGAQESASSAAAVTSMDHKEIKREVPPEAKPAVEALEKFLNATSLQERLKYTLAPDSMRSMMERYYSANPDGPIRVDAMGLVTFHPKPQIGGGAHAIFGVESKTWEFPVPVMLEDRGGSFKVDWLSFVEFKDRLLEKFLHTYEEGPARFHVGITRTHYFEDKVPNASAKEAFRISPAPPNPFMATVFVDKESTLGRDLRDKIPWGAQVFAIVELEWMKLGNQAWVQLSGVPQLNWYSVPAVPKAVRESSAPVEVPTETQKAVPIGR